MKFSNALQLVADGTIKATGEVMRVVGTPEVRNWCGQQVVRITAKDAFGRTHVFTHNEILPA
jgi:hypothetical protein